MNKYWDKERFQVQHVFELQEYINVCMYIMTNLKFLEYVVLFRPIRGCGLKNYNI